MSAIVIGDYTLGPPSGPPSTLLNDLVAFWKLNETSGARLDSVGANHLTDNNTVTSITGKVGNAAQFTAANLEYLSLADNADISTGDIDYTFAGWVFFNTTGTYNLIAKDVDTPASSRDYTFDWNGEGGGTNTFRWYINGGAVLVSSTLTATINTWYFFTIWHDATAEQLAIEINNNGTVNTASTSGFTLQESGAQFRLGARAYSGFEGYLNGYMDAVGFWKRVLTSDERSELYNGGNGKEWPF